MSIQKVQDLFKNNSIKIDLAAMLYSFQCIIETILQIEKSGSNFRQTISLVQNVEIKLNEGGTGIELAKLKLMQVLSKNPGYSQIKNIFGILSGEISNDNEGIEKLSREDIYCFKYAPIVSCDVQRSFSKYKSMLRDNRRNFKFDNLISHFETSCWYLFQN